MAAIEPIVAASVALAVTGDMWMALTLSLLEPTVQAVAFFFDEKAWARHMDTDCQNSVDKGTYYSA